MNAAEVLDNVIVAKPGDQAPDGYAAFDAQCNKCGVSGQLFVKKNLLIGKSTPQISSRCPKCADGDLSTTRSPRVSSSANAGTEKRSAEIVMSETRKNTLADMRKNPGDYYSKQEQEKQAAKQREETLVSSLRPLQPGEQPREGEYGSPALCKNEGCGFGSEPGDQAFMGVKKGTDVSDAYKFPKHYQACPKCGALTFGFPSHDEKLAMKAKKNILKARALADVYLKSRNPDDRRKVRAQLVAVDLILDELKEAQDVKQLRAYVGRLRDETVAASA